MPASSSGQREMDGSLAQRLLRTLSAAKGKYSGADEDMSFLTTLVQSQDFQALMGVQQTLALKKQRTEELAEEDAAAPEVAVTNDAGALLTDVCDVIFHSGVKRNSPEAKLLTILSSPHFHGVTSAHDLVARRDFGSTTDWQSLVASTADGASALNTSGDGTTEADGVGDGTKTVRLRKIADQPLGATVKIRQKDKAVVVGRVLHGSLAHQSGMLHSGDELVAINGTAVAGMSVDAVVDLVRASREHIDFQMRLQQPYHTSPHAAEECRISVRAQFSYDPRDDRLNPCREAGMAFDRGELLTVVSQADPRWWQAHRLDSGGQLLAGLIPGPLERQRREAIRKKRGSNEQQVGSSGTPHKRSWGGPRKKSRGYASTGRDDPDEAVEFASYEEVARMLPKHREPRPLVLIGAAGVGCTDVQDQLCRAHRHLYSRARPTSTALMRGSSAAEFLHVPVQEMLAGIAGNHFVEFSRVGNHWFGTSLASIQRVQRAGRTCVLHVPPKTLRTMRVAEVKPFVIFLAPPTLERLRAKLRYRRDSQSVVRSHRLDEQLAAMVATSAKMERVHGHHFDLRLVHEDLDSTVAGIDEAMERVRSDENWVPADWVRNTSTDSLVE